MLTISNTAADIYWAVREEAEQQRGQRGKMTNLEDYDDDFMVYVTAVLKVDLDLVPGDVSEKCIHLVLLTVCLHCPCYHGNIEDTVYLCTHCYSWLEYEDAT